MSRQPSRRVAESPGCEPLRLMFARAQKQGWSRWTDAEAGFLDAMWRFDQNLISGRADQGDNQNGKGDFFTDLVCVLLEGCSGKVLDYRPDVPGLIFPHHALDAAYPATGVVEVLIETKAAGAPKTSRNPSQKRTLGRPGSADLDKRIKEAGLKTIDLKAEWARTAGKGGGPTADFVSWLRRSKPLCYLLLAIRIIDDTDLKKAIRTADAANSVMDGCGLYCYRPGTKDYRSDPVPTHLQLDRVLSRICDGIRALP